MQKTKRVTAPLCAWMGAIALCAVSLTGFAQGDGVTFKPDRVRISIAGSQCKSARVRATNNTNAAIPDPTFELSGPSQFKLDRIGKKCPNPLPQGEFCQVYVKYCPTDFKGNQATLTFSASQQSIAVSGSATQRNR